MKKIFLILLGISFSFSAFAMGPYEPQDSIINNVISDENEETEEFDDPDIESNVKKAVNKSDQSVMSKVVGSVSTAAMGIGGMELAQGLSEQKSDKAATAEMQNYLSNLYCTYSDKQVKYGVTDVKIDDGNNLDLLREEFLTKAATLKYTKEQLGLKAGLESEVVFDDAATALYNNQGTSRGDSKFGRLSEAIMDETGSDAQIIAAQQEKSKNRVTGGAIAVVGGVAASIGGNALINSIGNKDKKSEKQQIEQESELVSEEEEQIEDSGQYDNIIFVKPTKMENKKQSEQVTEEKVEKETENTDYVDSPVSVPDDESYQVNENLDNMT